MEKHGQQEKVAQQAPLQTQLFISQQPEILSACYWRIIELETVRNTGTQAVSQALAIVGNS